MKNAAAALTLAIAAIAPHAVAKDSPQAAIDYLWSIPDPAEEETFRAGDFKINIGDWVKYHQTEPFKFRVANKAAPVDGYNFVVTYVSCSTQLLTPIGTGAGFEERTVSFSPPVRYGEVAVWQAEKPKLCVNAFACSYEVWVEGIDSPEARRVFGPIGTKGSTTAPDYDCFLEATSQLVMN